MGAVAAVSSQCGYAPEVLVQPAHKDPLVLRVQKIVAAAPPPQMAVPPEEERDHQRGLVGVEGPHGDEVEDQPDGRNQRQVEVVPDEGGGDRQIKVEREPACGQWSRPEDDQTGVRARFLPARRRERQLPRRQERERVTTRARPHG